MTLESLFCRAKFINLLILIIIDSLNIFKYQILVNIFTYNLNKGQYLYSNKVDSYVNKIHVTILEILIF